MVTSREAAYAELAADAGIRSILQAAIYSDDVTYGAIVDASGVAVAHSDPSQVGQRLPVGGRLQELLAHNGLSQLMQIWSSRGRTLELSAPLLLDDEALGEIRIGISTLLVRRSLEATVTPALAAALGLLLVAVLVAIFLAQAVLRPIHVIQSSLDPPGPRRAGRDPRPRGSRDAGPARRLRRRQRAVAGAAGGWRGAARDHRSCPSA